MLCDDRKFLFQKFQKSPIHFRVQKSVDFLQEQRTTMSEPQNSSRPRITLAEQQAAKAREWKEKVVQLLEAGYEVLETSEKLECLTDEPTWAGKRDADANAPFDYFEKMIPEEVFDFLADVAERVRIQKKTTLQVTTSTGYRKTIKAIHIKRFYGMIVFMENHAERTRPTMEALIRECRKSYPKNVTLGQNRFTAILNCLTPTNEGFDILFSMLRRHYQENWTGSGPMSTDETVFAFQPSKQTKACWEKFDPIPVVYIPRKPHKNGLLECKCVCKSIKTGLPYVLDFESHIRFPQITRGKLTRRLWNDVHSVRCLMWLPTRPLVLSS